MIEVIITYHAGLFGLIRGRIKSMINETSERLARQLDTWISLRMS